MLFYPESFKVSTPTDREIEVERDFHAPRESVFDAFTKPELVRRWLLGPGRLDHAGMRNRPQGRRGIPLCVAEGIDGKGNGDGRRVPRCRSSGETGRHGEVRRCLVSG